MSQNGVSIRRATEADLHEVLALCGQLGSPGEEALSPEKARQLFSRMESYPDYHVYVAETGAGIVGTFALLVMDSLSHNGAPSAIVEGVVVREDRRGAGIGKQMMEYAMKLSREAGCYKMALSSNNRREDAHAFYESLGFIKHGYSFVVTFPGGQ